MSIDFEQDFNDTIYSSFKAGYYIGMMSGTSLDGMDAVICQFDDSNRHNASMPLQTQDVELANQTTAVSKLIATYSVEFPPHLREVLLALCHPNATHQLAKTTAKIAMDKPPQSELEWFGWASREYGAFASQVINELLAQSGIDAQSILAIGCHGQTVRHCPHLGFSLQLVDPNIIAQRTGISVVTDFRRRDMAVGGQGAPLAPAFHLAQFGVPLHQGQQQGQQQGQHQGHTSNAATLTANHLIVVNLGGIANITILPAAQSDKICGFDTGPANILLDAWYQYHVKHSDLLTANPTYHCLYDQSGQWAQTGQVNHALLNQLMSHPYFKQSAPKSTGREDFNLEWLKQQIAHVQATLETTIAAQDVQATLTMLTVKTLSNAIKAEAMRLNLNGGDIIVCGGGGYNTYLLAQLDNELTQWQVLTSDDFGIAPVWIEAMAFAWLAQQTMMGNAGNLPAATGANEAVVLGQVCFA